MVSGLGMEQPGSALGLNKLSKYLPSGCRRGLTCPTPALCPPT